MDGKKERTPLIMSGEREVSNKAARLAARTHALRKICGRGRRHSDSGSASQRRGKGGGGRAAAKTGKNSVTDMRLFQDGWEWVPKQPRR